MERAGRRLAASRFDVAAPFPGRLQPVAVHACQAPCVSWEGWQHFSTQFVTRFQVLLAPCWFLAGPVCRPGDGVRCEPLPALSSTPSLYSRASRVFIIQLMTSVSCGTSQLFLGLHHLTQSEFPETCLTNTMCTSYQSGLTLWNLLHYCIYLGHIFNYYMFSVKKERKMEKLSPSILSKGQVFPGKDSLSAHWTILRNKTAPWLLSHGCDLTLFTVVLFFPSSNLRQWTSKEASERVGCIIYRCICFALTCSDFWESWWLWDGSGPLGYVGSV